jgi:hypothetical protein
VGWAQTYLKVCIICLNPGTDGSLVGEKKNSFHTRTRTHQVGYPTVPELPSIFMEVVLTFQVLN